METNRALVLLAMVSVAAVAPGCSKQDASTASPPRAASAPQNPAPPPAAARTVCAMVTAAEMSTIVGSAVAAEGEKTACTYQPAGATTPFVKVEIAWGDGEVALSSSRMLGRIEPGIANRMAGLGDEATAIGPALWVRTGEDLVTLTLMGIDDHLAAAKRIIDVMRPRMGPSAQPRPKAGGAAGSNGDQAHAGESRSDDVAKAMQLVGGMLKGLAAEADRSSRVPGSGSASGSGLAASASATAGEGAGGRGAKASGPAPAFVDESFAPSKGPSSIRIPLIAGLTIVGARHEPPRGDYEPMITVAAVADDKVSTVYSASLPEGVRLVVDRTQRRDDLNQAREYRPWYKDGDPPLFPGTTAMVLSRAVFTDLTTKGSAEFVRIVPDDNPLTALADRLSGGGAKASDNRYPGTITRVEPHTLAFPVLVNDEPTELPVIHARGTFGDETVDFYVLDDPDLPLIMRSAGRSTGRVVRIGFPVPAAARIEEKLKKESRVALHGIYFDFNKATIRPESESVLRDIASALTNNPDWRINIEGHTDNIGGDTFNLDLSRRRADAVKQALIDRYRVPATTLTTDGFGASRPDASNDSLSGRARNRRVELVRQ